MARVLAVDDSVSLRRLVPATLTAAGDQVTECANGADALDAAKQSAFNLVISDLDMPILDGLTLIKQMRIIAAYKFTPILGEAGGA